MGSLTLIFTDRDSDANWTLKGRRGFWLQVYAIRSTGLYEQWMIIAQKAAV